MRSKVKFHIKLHQNLYSFLEQIQSDLHFEGIRSKLMACRWLFLVKCNQIIRKVGCRNFFKRYHDLWEKLHTHCCPSHKTLKSWGNKHVDHYISFDAIHAVAAKVNPPTFKQFKSLPAYIHIFIFISLPTDTQCGQSLLDQVVVNEIEPYYTDHTGTHADTPTIVCYGSQAWCPAQPWEAAFLMVGWPSSLTWIRDPPDYDLGC